MSQQNMERSSPPAKRGCGATIAKGLLVLLLLVVAAGVAYYLHDQSIRRAALEETFLKDLEQPKNLALKAVQEHDAVKAALGDSVEDKGNLRRQGTGELNRSNAVFSFEVAGSTAKATVDATAKQAGGDWQIVEIKVKLSGGKIIAVPPPEKGAAQELEFKL